MNQVDKVEVVDFIINILKDHEQSLDTLVDRVEEALSTVKTTNVSTKISLPQKYASKIQLYQWEDFKKKCRCADYVGFNLTDSMFHVTAKKNENLFEYIETVPDLLFKTQPDAEDVIISGIDMNNLSQSYPLFNGRLQSGLELNTKQVSVAGTSEENLKKIVFNIDAEKTRVWLSKELDTALTNILFGEIKF